mmetsp:Transcript_35021/g.68964  ORF Transcript_35021/g.68964 Transcript_35021/m.68964 type:complete len:231 (+) Transcript_35021:561-1253(+)
MESSESLLSLLSARRTGFPSTRAAGRRFFLARPSSITFLRCALRVLNVPLVWSLFKSKMLLPSLPKSSSAEDESFPDRIGLGGGPLLIAATCLCELGLEESSEEVMRSSSTTLRPNFLDELCRLAEPSSESSPPSSTCSSSLMLFHLSPTLMLRVPFADASSLARIGLCWLIPRVLLSPCRYSSEVLGVVVFSARFSSPSPASSSELVVSSSSEVASSSELEFVSYSDSV